MSPITRATHIGDMLVGLDVETEDLKDIINDWPEFSSLLKKTIEAEIKERESEEDHEDE